MRGKPWVIIFGLLFWAPGCALQEVKFTVSEPSRVKLPGIRSIAVLEFAAPYAKEGLGREFSRRLRSLLQEQTDYNLIPDADIQQALAGSGLYPSQLQNRTVVRDLGRRMRTDSLLFGDLARVQVQRQTREELRNRKVEDRKYWVETVEPDGTTRTTEITVPVYQNYTHYIRTYSITVQARARLVKVKDGTVLWERDQTSQRDLLAEEDEGSETKNPVNEAVIAEQLQAAAQGLIADLLPRALLRQRILAVVSEDGPYRARIQAGVEAAQSQQWQEAERQWKMAAGLDPDRPEAHANLGVYYERANQMDKALAEYQAAAAKLGEPWSDYARDVENFQQGK